MRTIIFGCSTISVTSSKSLLLDSTVKLFLLDITLIKNLNTSFNPSFTENEKYSLIENNFGSDDIPPKDNTDIFKLIEEQNLNYMSNIIHIDCGICNYGMKNFFEKILPDKKEKINELFMSHNLNITNEHFEKFKKLYLELNNEEYKGTSVTMDMPVMYYNNFSVIRTSVWKSKEVKEIINKVNETGNIFYCRWGDGPLQTIIMTLYDKDKLSKLNFKYSKRLQRESFKDDNGEYHSYMPSNYTETSCVSENKKN